MSRVRIHAEVDSAHATGFGGIYLSAIGEFYPEFGHWDDLAVVLANFVENLSELCSTGRSSTVIYFLGRRLPNLSS